MRIALSAKRLSVYIRVQKGIFYTVDPFAKLSEARGNRHSGQEKRGPESRIFIHFWIPASAGMTEKRLFRLFTKPSTIVADKVLHKEEDSGKS